MCPLIERLIDATKGSLRTYVDGNVRHPAMASDVRYLIDVNIFVEDIRTADMD